MGLEGLLKSLGSGFTDMLQSDQLWSGLSTGADLWGAYNTQNALDKQFKLADQNMAMTQDAFNRDKESEERRQNLNFA